MPKAGAKALPVKSTQKPSLSPAPSGIRVQELMVESMPSSIFFFFFFV